VFSSYLSDFLTLSKVGAVASDSDTT